MTVKSKSSSSTKAKQSRSAKKSTEVKKPAAPRKTLEERRSAKLKAQKEREAAKIARGEAEPYNKERFYCTNKELLAELVKWRDSNQAEEAKIIATAKKANVEPVIDYTRRHISNELGLMILAIGNKLLNRSEFRNYTKEIKEDMMGLYEEKIIKGLKNYDFKFTNPFAFFTQCAWNSFITVLSKHYKHINIKKELMAKLAVELQTYIGINPESALSRCIKSYLGNEAGD